MSIKRLPARPESLKKFTSFILECAEGKGLSSEAAGRMELVLEEALVNIFNYAFPEGEGWIEVFCADDGPGLLIEIRDNGIPFDPLSLPDPDITADAPDRRIGGLGVYFMRKLTEKILYRRDGETNILTLNLLNR
jgi:serine/threonine-protein kinase RsbW